MSHSCVYILMIFEFQWAPWTHRPRTLSLLIVFAQCWDGFYSHTVYGFSFWHLLTIFESIEKVTLHPLHIRSVFAQDPDTLDTGIEGTMGRARASSDGCLFESSRLEEDVLPGQEVSWYGKTWENMGKVNPRHIMCVYIYIYIIYIYIHNIYIYTHTTYKTILAQF